MDATRTLRPSYIRHQSLRPSELLRRLRDPSPPVAGLLVDLCGVLYDDSIWRRWLFKLVQRLGLHTTYIPFFRLWQREYLERVKRHELEYWQALRMFLRAAGLTHGQIDEVEAAGHAQRRLFETEVLPLPGVVNVLNRLNELGIQLTLLSSACLDTRGVHQQLDRLGLESYFQTVFSMADLWQEHPSKSAFQVAIEWTGLAAYQVGFVGRDSAALAEAGQVGVRRIAVNYDEDATADIFMDNFDQLLDAVPWDTARAMVG